jgi:uncharacterized membrane protein YdjX (TVP38/TMEM64 family)
MDATRTSKRWPHWVMVGVVAAMIVYLVVVIWDHAAVIEWMERARPLPFFVAMAILPAVALPLTPFLLLAGATFGTGIALIGSLLAIAGNLALCYAIGRFGRSRLTPFLRRLGYALPDFEESHRSGALRFATLFKLSPLPNFVKNYGLGTANVPFPIALVVTLVISGLYAFGLIVVGHSIFQHDLRGSTIVILALVAVGFFGLRNARAAAAT